MTLKFTKGTDSEHTVKLDSSLVSMFWNSGSGRAGQKAWFTVQTAFVGNGAAIKVKGKSKDGKKLGQVKDKIKSNSFVGSFDIPEDIKIGDEIYFEVKLSKNGLSGESDAIPVLPPLVLKEIKWSAEEARRGDILKLTAEFRDIKDDTEADIVIFEYDRDGGHDRIAQVAAVAEKNKFEIEWEYEYHEDTDEIATEDELEKYGKSYNPPEYFFIVKIGDAVFGGEQESGLLTFKDYIELELKDDDGAPAKDEKYVIKLPDGSEKEGSLDGDGHARLDDIPPGKVKVEFPDIDQIDSGKEE